MALRHIESFDAVVDDARMARFYGSYVGSQLGVSDNGHAFGFSADGHDVVLTTRELVNPNENTWIIGFAFRPDGATAIDTGGPEYPYVAVANEDGEQIRLELFTRNPANTKPGGIYYGLRVMRGATELAATNESFDLAVGFDDERGWVYFEWKVTIDNTSGTFELRYHRRGKSGEGEQTATWDAATSGLDTQNQTSTGGDRITFSWETGNPSRRVAYDDIYVCDSTGSVNNDFLGRTAVVVAKPNQPGTGDTQDWSLTGSATSIGNAWDEPRSSGDDDRRATSKTLNDVALCTVETLPLLRNVTIHGVAQHISAKMETTGSLTLHHRWRKTTGTPAEVDGASFVVSTTAWVGDTDVRETDPNTAVAFVVADLDSYQHGVRNGG